MDLPAKESDAILLDEATARRLLTSYAA